MAFPVVEATNTSDDIGTSHTVALPSGIEAGDLLIVLFASDGAEAVGFPNEGVDWIQLLNKSHTTVATLAMAYRIADGGEGASIEVTTPSSEISAHISLRISGYSGTPECSAGIIGYSTLPDPDTLTPSWGSDDVLWVAFCGQDGNSNVSTFPSGYSGGISKGDLGSSGCSIGAAFKEATASSENPPVFSMTVNDQWIAATLGIKPAGGVTHEASITFSGAGAMVVSAVMTYAASIAFAGVGTLSINGQLGLTVYGSISFSGAGALSISAVMTYAGKVTFSGEGSLAIFGGLLHSASITFGGEGTLSILGGLLLKAKLFMLGRGILSINGVLILAAAISFSGEGFLTIKARYLGALFVECITTHNRDVEVLTTHNKQVEALTTHNKQIDSKITGG